MIGLLMLLRNMKYANLSLMSKKNGMVTPTIEMKKQMVIARDILTTKTCFCGFPVPVVASATPSFDRLKQTSIKNQVHRDVSFQYLIGVAPILTRKCNKGS